MRNLSFIFLYTTAACAGAGSSAATADVESGDSSVSASTGETGAVADTSASSASTGITGDTSAVHSGTTGDSGPRCGPGTPPDCYFDEGMCVYPSGTPPATSPMTDSRIDQIVALDCGPMAVVSCSDVNAIAYAAWAGETAFVHVFDAATREPVAEIYTSDGGETACDNERYEGDPMYLPCALAVNDWVNSAYELGCDIWDGDTTGAAKCSNDPATCIRDEVPR